GAGQTHGLRRWGPGVVSTAVKPIFSRDLGEAKRCIRDLLCPRLQYKDVLFPHPQELLKSGDNILLCNPYAFFPYFG
uniref:Uncharacterized protein n=1 Tax=Zonotrichia albicollis TaxID=44394 RepID=A0A8D2MFI3_ZONAL